jgi:serine/threonine-protein kinase RsbW
MSSAPDPAAWSWSADVTSAGAARHAVIGWLRARGMSELQLVDVAIVVSEAVTNAVTHAYVGRQPPGDVQVRVALDGDQAMVVVEDQGSGLRPRPDSPGLGYGLALMIAMSKRVEAQSEEGVGTRLRAWFDLRGAGG